MVRKLLLVVCVCLFIILLVPICVKANNEHMMVSTEEFITELKKENIIITDENSKSLNSITVDNNNGTNTIYLFNQDIRYIDDNGEVVDKDLSLTASSDRERIKKGYILTVKSNDIATWYPISLNSNGIIMGDIELVPKDSNAVLKEISNEEAMYESVFTGINMIFKPEYGGFSATIEAENLVSLDNIKFQLKDVSSHRESFEDGKILLEKENALYEITGSNITNLNGEVVGISTLTLDKNNDIIMEYEIGGELSKNETITTGINVIIQKNNMQSVTLYEDEVYHSDGYNYIGTKVGHGTARTFIKFDLSALEGIQYDKILSAYYTTQVDKSSNSGVADMYMVTGEWDSNLDHMDFMPSINYNYKLFSLNMAQTGASFITKKFYITSAVQEWLQGFENNGILIKATNDEGWAKFAAPSNSEFMPYLMVTYSNNNNTPITKGIKRGEVYYIINKECKKSIRVFEEIPPSEVLLCDFSMSDMEGWHILYDSTIDGIEYFKIRQHTSASFLEASQPDDQNVSSVYTTTINNSDGQKWRIVRNWNGSYKLIPKNSDGTKALSVYTNISGYKELVLAPITIDFNENDDWTFLPINKGNASLYGTCMECWNIDAQAEIANVKSLLSENGYNCVDYHNCSNDITSVSSNINNLDMDEVPEEMGYRYLKAMFNSDIWYSSAHGFESRISFKESRYPYYESKIGPITTTEQDSDENGTISNVYGISDYEGDLNKLQFAFMNSCSIGANNGNESLVGTMYEEGAHCIIAHTEQVSVKDCKKWQEDFNLAFSVSDVETAILFADRINLINSADRWLSKNILGDTSFFYNYEANAVYSEDIVEYTILNDNATALGTNSRNISKESVNPIGTSITSFNELYYEFDANGNIHGFSKKFKESYEYKVQLLFSYNDKYNQLGNNYIINIPKAMMLARKFITEEMNLSISSEHEISYTKNSYSTEFVYKCKNKDAGPGEIKNIVVYIEEDENDNQYVTFYMAEYGQ